MLNYVLFFVLIKNIKNDECFGNKVPGLQVSLCIMKVIKLILQSINKKTCREIYQAGLRYIKRIRLLVTLASL